MYAEGRVKVWISGSRGSTVRKSVSSHFLILPRSKLVERFVHGPEVFARTKG